MRAAAASADTGTDTLELTEANVEAVLDEVRPYLMADGGNVEFVEIDGLVVRLRLKGACGSCPSSLTTMTMGIKRRLMERIPVGAAGGRLALGTAGDGGCRRGRRRGVPVRRGSLLLLHAAALLPPPCPPRRTSWRWSRWWMRTRGWS